MEKKKKTFRDRKKQPIIYFRLLSEKHELASVILLTN